MNFIKSGKDCEKWRLWARDN